MNMTWDGASSAEIKKARTSDEERAGEPSEMRARQLVAADKLVFKDAGSVLWDATANLISFPLGSDEITHRMPEYLKVPFRRAPAAIAALAGWWVKPRAHPKGWTMKAACLQK